ncbi:MAG: hypothetical protein QIT36_gp075 [Methanophagales virus GBV301]|uniref:DOD-type homing endonuclease domain-containing protein n=1 Tax=Methanophagales virus GBV301 TaxID=2999280 RepID=A0A9E8V9A3_9CAUD|nr:MAG: hypothetical protein QIT36_gp075 [Methanophagales virus GBV301]WAE39499.1 MAG: hypothetical protein LDLAKGPJ_00075 [Methanophagales virus GBV301]
MGPINVHNLEILKELAESELNYRHAKTLHIPNRGMYLPVPHAKLIFNKHKTVILKDRKFNITGIPFLYCDSTYAYGVLELGKPKEIKNEGQFKATQKYHRVTEAEFKKWHWDFPLYAYPVKEVRNFKEPIRINLPTGVQNFFRNPIGYLETGEYPFTAKHSLNLPYPIEVACSNCGNWIYVPHTPLPSQCPHCGATLVETEETKSRMIPLPKEEYERIYKDYPNRPLPKKYYKDQRGGVAWCLSSPKTKILTKEGWKPWYAVQVGDEVITHRGRYKKVTRKDVFENVLKWVKVEFQFDGVEKLKYSTRVTENHPFLTKEGWKEAKDLKVGDKVLSKTPKRCLNCGAPIPHSWMEKVDFLFCSDKCFREYEWTEESLDTSYIDKKVYDNPFVDIYVTVTKVEPIVFPKDKFYLSTRAYSIEVEDDHSYMIPLAFSHNSQWHIRGIKPEDKEAYDKGKISFEEMILHHSLHQDLRWTLNGVSVLPQCTITESDMESYVRGMLGQLNPEQKGPANVQKVKVIPKVEIAKPTMPKSKMKEFLIDEKGAKLINKIIIHETSYWISPGEVGCVSANTLVLTDHGYEYIKHLQPGDLVYTHKGRFKRVLRVIRKEKQNWCYKLSPYKGFPVNFTNHKIFINENELKDIASFTRDDRLYLAKPEIEEIAPNDLELEIPPGYEKRVKWDEDLAKWIGYFVGDGSIENVDKGAISFSCASRSEAEKYAKLSRKLFGADVHIYPRRNHHKPKTDSYISYWDVEFKDRGLARWLSANCYYHPEWKKERHKFKIFPREAIYHPLRLLRKYIDGFKEADGWDTEHSAYIGNSSRYAIGQAFFMLLRLGKEPNIRISSRPKTTQYYTLSWIENRQTHKKGTPSEHGYSLPIRAFERKNNATITQYDLTVEDDHSYTVSNFHISNSLPYTWAYMGTIWTGRVETATERGDYHELFFYPDKDLPEPNKKFFDGRFILRAFKGEAARGGKTWWMWKSTKNPYPQNPWCYCDQGEHEILPLDKIKHWGHEDYPEWKTRKDEC